MMDFTSPATAVNWNTIILGILTLFTTIVTTIGAIYLARISEQQRVTRGAAIDAAVKVESVRTDLRQQSDVVGGKLDNIHSLVNNRLTQAMVTIDELKTIITKLAPGDPRVGGLVDSATRERTPST